MAGKQFANEILRKRVARAIALHETLGEGAEPICARHMASGTFTGYPI
jgi:hypothetical protein